MEKMKTYSQRLNHGNYIVRDHLVHGIRTLPGVALLEMIYRLSAIYLGTRNIELRKIVFMQPIVTSEHFDIDILVSYTPMGSHWSVTVSSRAIKNGETIDDSHVKNMECSLFMNESKKEDKRFDVLDFTATAEKQWDMDDIYEMARKASITHDVFMKTTGTAYQRGNQEVMQLQLSELAFAYNDHFYAHVAFLDGASMAGSSFGINGKLNWISMDHSPYMPISIERFCIYRTLPEQIFTYTEEPNLSGNKLINPDLVSRDISVFDENGELLVEIEKFSLKRIREAHLIKKLVDQEAYQTPQSPKWPGTVDEREINDIVIKSNGEVKPVIVSYLKQEIANVLNVEVQKISVNEGFYEMGLDSIQLLGLVKVLEQKVSSSIYPTLLFEYATIENLSDYLEANHREAFQGDYDSEPNYPVDILSSEETKVTIVTFLKKEVAKVLNVDIQKISVDEGFYEMGLDSIQLLGLVKVLEQKVNSSMYPTLLFEYATIESLSDYLEENYKDSFHVSIRENDLPAELAVTPIENTGETLFFERVWIKTRIEKVECKTKKRTHFVVLDQCCRDLQAAFEPLHHINSVITLDGDPTNATMDIEYKFNQVMRIVQSCLQDKEVRDVLIQIVSNNKGARYIYALEGLLKTAFLENSKIHSQIISIENIHSFTGRQITELLENEASSHTSGMSCILYKSSALQRYTFQLKELELQKSQPAFKRNGVYVFTGGLGGIALLVANHLASQQKVRLALIGRSELTESKNKAILQLVKKGAEVVYYQADIGLLDEAERVRKQILDQWGYITGVFHCAGSIKDQIIIKKNRNDCRTVFQPKVNGISNIDNVTKNDELDFFAAFSSLSAITGNIGQADYASANAWMDMFVIERQAKVRRGERAGQSVSINWPFWLEGGMKIDQGFLDMFYLQHGYLPMPTDEGLQALDAALCSDTSQVLVFHGDAVKVRNQFRESMDADSFSAPQKKSLRNYQCGRNNDDIAIIGVAGKYPMAANIEEFFENLKEGRDCISGIPKERWLDNLLPYDVEQIYNFGGFIDGIDEFDPLFFNISANYAKMMDPQARLFLQTAWEACEDAGYPLSKNRHNYASSSENSVGVFAGVFWNSYEMFSAEMTQRGTPIAFGVSSASIANMVSYCLNFHGPSMAVDSMCSSSLTAVHLASESIRRGECHFAVAGGVNLVTHPHKYLFLQQAQFLSSDGRCRSFGKDGDGYVPGEGVGAVFMTSLSRANAEGYSIYGVIKGSAINHVGKTSGATIPDPIAQSEVIIDALCKSSIDPRTISYVEAHGTGTSLGDPIEMHGLERAFGKWGTQKKYCPVGSVKSNIGHLEAASGIAGITKILLQFKHKKLFPSLHAEQTNPHIPFENSSFYIQRELREWHQPEVELNGEIETFPRRAGISSFGANGSNAHVILEEYIPDTKIEANLDRWILKNIGEVIVPLSAKNNNSLIRYAENLMQFLIKDQQLNANEENSHSRLARIAHTLQIGRETMMHRVAFIVQSYDELIQALNCFIQGREDGNMRLFAAAVAEPPVQNEQDDYNIHSMINAKDYIGIAQLWTKGFSISWNALYNGTRPLRMSLPTYPFAKERYWVPQEIKGEYESIKQYSTDTEINFLQRKSSLLESGPCSANGHQEVETRNCWNYAMTQGKI